MNMNEIYKKFYRKYENSYLHTAPRNNIITLNGQGNSGKTTIAQLLADKGIGINVNLYKTRDRFYRYVYQHLDRTQEQCNVEVYGIPSLAWIALEFQQHLRPVLNAGMRVILDHYIGDFMADMLPDMKDMNGLKEFMKSVVYLPWLTKTRSFYLDIDYDTYIERHTERKHVIEENVKVAAENFVPETLFDERRQRYRSYVDEDLLIEIDATEPVDAIVAEILKHIQD